MVDPNAKDYVAVVQCDLARQRCSGYGCEKAFFDRTGGFAAYPKEKPYRTLYMTCGGCCGQGMQRLLTDLTRRLKKEESMPKERVVVQLASCITRDNFHSPPCPHLELLKNLITRAGLDVCDDTFIDEISEKRRREGRYTGDG